MRPTPVLTNLSPSTGAAGMLVTITGANFGATQGSSTVKFNGTTATPTSWSPTQISVPVPSGATTGNVVVRTSGVDTNGLNFDVSTLTSISVTPTGLSVPVNSQQRFTAIGIFANASTQDLGANATWTSLDSAIATVDSAGLVTALTEGPGTTVQATFGAVSGSASLSITGPTFTPVGKLNQMRSGHTATLLQNGKVLIVGGLGGYTSTPPTAELYDPVTQTFTYTGNPTMVRYDHTATLLPNGKVLIAGGLYYQANSSFTTASAELYDPATGTFSSAASMNSQRYGHTATLLDNGLVLIAAGRYFTSSGSFSAISELYNPATGAFTPTGTTITDRVGHLATRLNNGKVLITSGYAAESAEIYDPATGTFTGTGQPVTPGSASAALLADGSVLLAGGSYSCPSCSTYARAAEQLYDPASGTFAITGSLSLERRPTATRLNDGTVLIVGGADSNGAERFDPATQTFTGAGGTVLERGGHTATLLNDGTVLIAGGNRNRTAEIYSPVPPAPPSLTITPTAASLVIGEMRVFRVVDNNGNQRDDASWTLSDPTLATITGDGSPRLTATASGTLTLTATIQGVSADAQITIGTQPSHAAGTVVWSVPAIGGIAPTQVVQNSARGPALFAVTETGGQSVIQALAPDGQLLWQTHWAALNGKSIPDGVGGLLVVQNNTCNTGQNEPLRIIDIDADTGEYLWRIEAAPLYLNPLSPPWYCYPQSPWFAVRHDGILAITSPGNTSGLPELMLVDARTGQLEWAPPIPQSSFKDSSQVNRWGYSRIGPPVVDSDGSIYVEYETRHVAYPPQVEWATLWLLKIATDNTTTTTQLTTTTTDTNLFPGRILPLREGGVLATWTFDPASTPRVPDPNSLRAAHVSAAGAVTEYALPVQPPDFERGTDGLPVLPTFLLGEGDTVFASYGSDLQSFNAVTGGLNWAYSSAALSSTVSVIGAESTGGALAKVTDTSGNETVIRFDAAGVTSAGLLGGRAIQHVTGLHWLGATTINAAMAYAGPFVESSDSGFSALLNQQSGKKKANMFVTPDTAVEPEASDTIFQVYSQLKTKLEADPTGSCATWLTHPTDPYSKWQSYFSYALPVYEPDPNDPDKYPNKRAYGHGVFKLDLPNLHVDDTIVAVQNGLNPDKTKPTGIPAGWIVAVNNNSAFYKARPLNNLGRFESNIKTYNQPNGKQGPLLGGTARYQAETLLHEMGHTLMSVAHLDAGHKADGMQPDYDDTPAQNANALLVFKKCQAVIETFTP